MNDENFDNVFGEKLKHGKNFVFTDANWDVMEKNIRNYYAERNEKRRWMWLLLPLLLLLIFTAGSVFIWHTLQTKINNLNAEIIKLQTAKSFKNESTTAVKYDTIFQHVVVKQCDTIYRTIIIQNKKLENFSSEIETIHDVQNVFATSKNDFSLQENLKPSHSELNQKRNQNSQTGNLIFKGENKAVLVFENKLAAIPTNHSADVIITKKENSLNQQKSDSINNSAHTVLSLKQDSSTIISPSNVAPNSEIAVKEKNLADSSENKKTFVQKKELPPIKIEPIKIKRFEIGFSGGVAAYSGDSVVRQTGYSFGLRANFIISKRLKLLADVQVAESDYQKNTIYYTKDVPYIAPPTKYDVFSTVYCDQTFLNYGIGLQYALTENKRVNPYVGLGVIGQSKINEQFDYRFINGYKQETAVITTRKDAVVKFPFLRLNIGAQFQLFKKFSAQLESSYDVKLNSDVYSKSFLQIRGIILYPL